MASPVFQPVTNATLVQYAVTASAHAVLEHLLFFAISIQSRPGGSVDCAQACRFIDFPTVADGPRRSTDASTQRRALAELATWLRVLGFKADYRMDRLRVFGIDLWFSDDLWFYNGAVGSRNVAVELATIGEHPRRQSDDDELSCASWEDGTRLTKAELRAWLRA